MYKVTSKNSSIFFGILIFNLAAFAFPEMTRHHYVNCSACHVSQSGGGVLNAYGRSLSSELLSSWGSVKEARAFYSIEPDPVNEWLNTGGDIRSVQWHFEDANLKAGKWFIMQAEITAAITYEKWTAMMSVGQMQISDNTWRAVSPRYYLSHQFSDEFSVRAGHTIPVFGLQIPQHNFLVKDNLLLGQGTERDSIETFWNGVDWNFTLAAAKSSFQSYVRDEEKSVSAHVARTFLDSDKLGFSLWSGDATTFRRTMTGLDAVMGFTEKFYSLSEVNYVLTTSKAALGNETKSVYELLKFGYEFKKGMHAQVVQQFGKPDTEIVGTEMQSYGVGGLWYPRPHFELEVLWQKQRTLGRGTSDFADYAYLLTHFYF